ncbi:YkvA family protein [Chryseobacterium sp. R2A-55]|uniref:YkvA family protein n=1 Tax=Chryseobacterium sp. R2A-55 TaxID=2744445 RepID=UPI001F47B865|nr:YkvA family protein [Chryseobacterium sp. R2A-55]
MWVSKFREKVKEQNQKAALVYYAIFDRRTPVAAKILAVVTIGYLLSPIDFIPDFIPVLGLLDDLILVPILIGITVSLIPKSILDDLKKKKSPNLKSGKKWVFAIPLMLFYGFLVFVLYTRFFSD